MARPSRAEIGTIVPVANEGLRTPGGCEGRCNHLDFHEHRDSRAEAREVHDRIVYLLEELDVGLLAELIGILETASDHENEGPAPFAFAEEFVAHHNWPHPVATMRVAAFISQAFTDHGDSVALRSLCREKGWDRRDIRSRYLR